MPMYPVPVVGRAMKDWVDKGYSEGSSRDRSLWRRPLLGATGGVRCRGREGLAAGSQW